MSKKKPNRNRKIKAPESEFIKPVDESSKESAEPVWENGEPDGEMDEHVLTEFDSVEAEVRAMLSNDDPMEPEEDRIELDTLSVEERSDTPDMDADALLPETEPVQAEKEAEREETEPGADAFTTLHDETPYDEALHDETLDAPQEDEAEVVIVDENEGQVIVTDVPPPVLSRKLKKRLKKERRGRRKWRSAVAMLLTTAVVIVGLVAWKVLDIPNWKPLDVDRITNLNQTSLLYDANGALVTALQGKENRTVVPLAQVPMHVRNAFIAAEDLRFYKHPGFDIVRIFGSLVSNIKNQSYAEGASTITQQLIKLSHLTMEKTLARKVQEIYLAWQLERKFTKDEILEMYLNLIYFGNGAYGIQAASQAYFEKDVQDLTLTEAASLAAAIKATSAYSPHIKPENNANRRKYILSVMAENNMITLEEAEVAKATEIVAHTQKQAIIPYGWYVDASLDEAERLLGVSAEELLGGGYRIYTALDTSLQDIADSLYKNANNFPANAKDGTHVQSAMAAVDTATGELRALVGGRSYDVRRGLNRATQMRRQPGSSIKPLAVYGPALTVGYTTASVLLDEPGDFNGYTPRNSGNHYYGPVTMRTALTHSLNVASVRLLQEIGIPTARSFLQNAGVPLHDRDRNLSLALGAMTEGVTPAELAASYAVFANGGSFNSGHTVRKIIGPDGAVVYEHKGAGQTALSPQNAYLMTSMLQSVTSWGTGSRMQAAGIPVAGKTGTNSISNSSGNRDIWMAAYNPDIAVAVWMGFDVTDNSHKLSGGISGGDAPAALAASFFKKAYAGKKAPAFKQPEGIVSVAIDTQSIPIRGYPMLASNYTPAKYRFNEVFLSTNKPTRVSDVWQAPVAANFFYIEPGDGGMPRLVFQYASRTSARIERIDPWGGTVVLNEIVADAGVVSTFTDWQAQGGVKYTYRITPLNPDLLAEGVVLEGPSITQMGQVTAANSSIWDNLLGFFSTQEGAGTDANTPESAAANGAAP